MENTVKKFIGIILILASSTSFALGEHDKVCRENLTEFAKAIALSSTIGHQDVKTQITILNSDSDKKDYRLRDVWNTYNYTFSIGSNYKGGSSYIEFDVAMSASKEGCRIEPHTLINEYSK